MEIGRLNNRVQIQSYTETQDDTSFTNRIWTTVYTVWADITPVKGNVMFDSKQVGANVTHKIIIRYQDYITTENWVYFDSRRFRIRFVRNLDERNRFIELLCEEEGFALTNFTADTDTAGEPLRDLLG